MIAFQKLPAARQHKIFKVFHIELDGMYPALPYYLVKGFATDLVIFAVIPFGNTLMADMAQTLHPGPALPGKHHVDGSLPVAEGKLPGVDIFKSIGSNNPHQHTEIIRNGFEGYDCC